MSFKNSGIERERGRKKERDRNCGKDKNGYREDVRGRGIRDSVTLSN